MLESSARNILEGSLLKGLARFGTPLALGMALQTTFNLVDAYLIAQLPLAESGPAMGALGLCDQVAALGTILSYGVTTATTALLAHQKGAGDLEAVRKTAWQSILLVLFLSAIFFAIGIAFSGLIVRDVIGAKGEVANVATEYLRVIVGGSFSIFLLLQLTSIQRALGSATTPVALLVLGNALNVVFAVLLIFGPGSAPPLFAWGPPLAKALHLPRMGMLGAAWATIFARTVALLPNVVVLARRFHLGLPHKGERGADRAELSRLIWLAWPISTQFFLRIVAMLLVNSLVARFFTSSLDQTGTTALGLVFRLDTMAMFLAMGWGNAAQTFVGQNLGAQKRERAVLSGWVCVLYDAVTNVGLIALFLLAGEPILRIFSSDPRAIDIALQYLHTIAPSYLALGLGVVLGNAMAGAGATRTTMWIDLAVIGGVQFPLCILLTAAFQSSMTTLFSCVAVTYVVGAVVYAIVYLRRHWLPALPLPVTRP